MVFFSSKNTVHDSSMTSLTNGDDSGVVPARPRKVVPFKKMYPTLQERKEQVFKIQHQFPDKIPVVVERYGRERLLPQLDKPKYLVPQSLNVSHFITVVRSRLDLPSNQTIYLLINKSTVVSVSETFTNLYNRYKDDDGFLYMTYASQDMFG